ncbi:MAG: hypothetical protein HY782_01260 [Chloroflexi bacterium]|nr:hypothetical protein [Chloroflexota bacterium]
MDKQRRGQLIENLARRAERMRLTAPAILFLEMNRPLAFLGAQLLWATQPFLNLWLDHADLREFTLLLEDPAGVQELIERLESV